MSAHIECINCFHIFKSPDKIYYTKLCNPSVHIFCIKCINHFQSTSFITCKICDHKYSFNNTNISELKSNPWSTIKPINLCGATPQQIFNQSIKCIKWWEQQQNIKLDRYKNVALNYKKQLKVSRQNNESQTKTLCNEISDLTKQVQQFKINSIKLKDSYENLKNTAKSLEKQYVEKSRQFENLNEKYTQILKHKSAKNNSSYAAPLHSHSHSRSRSYSHSTESINNSNNNRNYKRKRKRNNHIIVPETVISDNNLYNKHGKKRNNLTQYHPYDNNIGLNNSHGESQRMSLSSIPGNNKKLPNTRPRAMNMNMDMDLHFDDDIDVDIDVDIDENISMVSGTSAVLNTNHHTPLDGMDILPRIAKNDGLNHYHGHTRYPSKNSNSKSNSNNNNDFYLNHGNGEMSF